MVLQEKISKEYLNLNLQLKQTAKKQFQRAVEIATKI